MDVDGTVVADSGRGRELVVYVLWGELEEGQDEKVTYMGGLRKCFVVKEAMGVEKVQRMATEIIGSNLSEQKIWYNLKYDSQMLVTVEGDMDVRIVFKVNYEHVYWYAVYNNGPRKRAQKTGAACERGTHTFEHVVVCATSGTNGDATM